MYVPNYIPQPIEIAGNVAEAKWSDKLLYLRRFTLWTLWSLLLAVIFSQWINFHVPLLAATAMLVGSVTFLAIARNFTRNSTWEGWISIPLFVITLAFLGIFSIQMTAVGWPIGSAIVGISCASLYAYFCGRDFSFIGQWVLSLIVSNVALASYCLVHHISTFQSAHSLVINSVILTYFCYDSASIMSRRRIGEESLASIDLYRDVLNFFGYSVRCWQHWKRHQIWTFRKS